jgi:hypothetical protein
MLDFVTIALYSYLHFSRLVFRATFTFFMPVIVLIIILILNSDKKVFIKKLHKFIEIAAILIITVVLCFLEYPDKIVYNSDNSDIYNYILENDEKIFVSSGPAGGTYNFNTSLNAIFYHPTAENLILNGIWIEGSHYDYRLKQKYKINNLYYDIINNENMYIVISVNYGKTLNDYYNAHYADNNESISLILVKEFRSANVYQVVSE